MVNYYIGGNFGGIEAPGLGESLIPIWGPGKQALYDFENGDLKWGLFNTALAASDILPARAVAGGIAKGAWKLGSHTWSATSKWLTKTGWREFKGQEMHHWLFHRNQGIGKLVPDSIKNQPWNLMAMPADTTFHDALHGGGRNPMNLAESIWNGTPRWFKALTISSTGRIVDGAR